MKAATIIIVSFVFIQAFHHAHANSIGACQATYKTCVSLSLDKLEPYIKAFENNPKECRRNVKEWAKIDYQFIHCQDEYNSCKGKEGSVWSRMQNTPDISLSIEKSSEHGLSESKLKSIESDTSEFDNLKSVLVSRNGKLIYEKYHGLGFDPKPHNMNSITKVITSLLVGIAIDKRYLESEEMPIKPFFSNYYNKQHDPRKDQITIKHALTMATGINLSDQTYYFEDITKWLQFLRDDNASDWILNTEMLLSYKPGEIWMYNTFNNDLLTSILSTSTGMSTLDFADKYLFKPLKIKNYVWHHDSKENYYGGFSLHLRPRAMLRIGQMALDGGIYDDVRIVSEEWLNKSLANQYSLGGEQGWEYGYLWWRYRIGEYQVISALGYGGQILALVPSLDLVIAITTDSHVCSSKEERDQFWGAMDLANRIILSIDK